jgi:hypothetical protein
VSARRRHGTATTSSGLFHQRVSPYRRKVVLHDVESISCTEEDERGVMRINPGTRHPPDALDIPLAGLGQYRHPPDDVGRPLMTS